MTIPHDYSPKLTGYELQRAISEIKRIFLKKLSKNLHLQRVSAPLFVKSGLGMNDNLSGVERPVVFDIPAAGMNAEIVQSLAKWKRIALWKYNFRVGEGVVTDMNAIRRDEELDNIHSIYVDQWDWEKIITAEDRNVEYLKETVGLIVDAIVETNSELGEIFPALSYDIKREISFVTSQELEDMYPNLMPDEREWEYVKEHKTAFIMQIGDKLASGKPHGSRSPDYDDWTLNGDLIVWNEILNAPLELSSMGIRVDEKALDIQLEKSGCNDRRSDWYHSMLLSGKLPLTIGGGIGQSRLCMCLLQCAHIGEVQSSVWDHETIEQCQKNNIPLL